MLNKATDLNDLCLNGYNSTEKKYKEKNILDAHEDNMDTYKINNLNENIKAENLLEEKKLLKSQHELAVNEERKEGISNNKNEYINVNNNNDDINNKYIIRDINVNEQNENINENRKVNEDISNEKDKNANINSDKNENTNKDENLNEDANKNEDKNTNANSNKYENLNENSNKNEDKNTNTNSNKNEDLNNDGNFNKDANQNEYKNTNANTNKNEDLNNDGNLNKDTNQNEDKNANANLNKNENIYIDENLNENANQTEDQNININTNTNSNACININTNSITSTNTNINSNADTNTNENNYNITNYVDTNEIYINSSMRQKNMEGINYLASLSNNSSLEKNEKKNKYNFLLLNSSSGEKEDLCAYEEKLGISCRFFINTSNPYDFDIRIIKENCLTIFQLLYTEKKKWCSLYICTHNGPMSNFNYHLYKILCSKDDIYIYFFLFKKFIFSCYIYFNLVSIKIYSSSSNKEDSKFNDFTNILNKKSFINNEKNYKNEESSISSNKKDDAYMENNDEVKKSELPEAKASLPSNEINLNFEKIKELSNVYNNIYDSNKSEESKILNFLYDPCKHLYGNKLNICSSYLNFFDMNQSDIKKKLQLFINTHSPTMINITKKWNSFYLNKSKICSFVEKYKDIKFSSFDNSRKDSTEKFINSFVETFSVIKNFNNKQIKEEKEKDDEEQYSENEHILLKNEKKNNNTSTYKIEENNNTISILNESTKNENKSLDNIIDQNNKIKAPDNNIQLLNYNIINIHEISSNTDNFIINENKTIQNKDEIGNQNFSFKDDTQNNIFSKNNNEKIEGSSENNIDKDNYTNKDDSSNDINKNENDMNSMTKNKEDLSNINNNSNNSNDKTINDDNNNDKTIDDNNNNDKTIDDNNNNDKTIDDNNNHKTINDNNNNDKIINDNNNNDNNNNDKIINDNNNNDNNNNDNNNNDNNINDNNNNDNNNNDKTINDNNIIANINESNYNGCNINISNSFNNNDNMNNDINDNIISTSICSNNNSNHNEGISNISNDETYNKIFNTNKKKVTNIICEDYTNVTSNNKNENNKENCFNDTKENVFNCVESKENILELNMLNKNCLPNNIILNNLNILITDLNELYDYLENTKDKTIKLDTNYLLKEENSGSKNNTFSTKGENNINNLYKEIKSDKEMYHKKDEYFNIEISSVDMKSFCSVCSGIQYDNFENSLNHSEENNYKKIEVFMKESDFFCNCNNINSYHNELLNENYNYKVCFNGDQPNEEYYVIKKDEMKRVNGKKDDHINMDNEEDMNEEEQQNGKNELKNRCLAKNKNKIWVQNKDLEKKPLTSRELRNIRRNKIAKNQQDQKNKSAKSTQNFDLKSPRVKKLEKFTNVDQEELREVFGPTGVSGVYFEKSRSSWTAQYKVSGGKRRAKRFLVTKNMTYEEIENVKQQCIAYRKQMEKEYVKEFLNEEKKKANNMNCSIRKPKRKRKMKNFYEC
ncbi:transcription factor with AP2 domain(s), putative [Plasmodium relictum]|uniref:Transcription factor with AP2 domain(S), putative n=1 Tax=Plasmodium relictum TaxID=85471 RepID=A0A1J1HE28_PLARL|nr:transcription factor with AP2 domain(s), putative [Plasmodium relictum]CRH04055.1 transcription factor with AP2 domain(s), putative [Plasmodium relictum]